MNGWRVICATALLGACGGEPAESDDDSVDASPPMPTGDPVWSRRGDGVGAARAVAADANGNVVVAGVLRDGLDFGRGVVTSAGGNDGLVARFDADGVATWSLAVGGALDDTINAVAFDRDGNAVVAGAFQGELVLGGRTLTSAGGNDVLLAKIDPQGGIVWARRFGSPGFDVAYGVACGATGDIVVMGAASNALDVGGTLAGAGATFMVRLDGGGDFVSGRLIEPSSVNGVSIDGANHVAVGGSFSDTIDLGTGPMTSRASTDGFVARFDPSWSTVFAAPIGDGSYTTIYSVASDASGAVVSGGMTQANGAATSMVVVERHAAQGEGEWTKRLGTAEYAAANGVVVDGNGNVVLAGYVRDGTLDLGCGALASPADPSNAFAGDIFVAKLGRDGDCLWSKAFGDSGNQFGAAAAVDTTGNVLLAGDFQQAVDFGTGSLMARHSNEPFLAKFRP